MNKFVLCGDTYNAIDFTINTVCDLEDLGINIENIDNVPFKTIRAYVSLCLGKSVKEAGELINKHVAEGGKLEDVYLSFQKAIEESDFFRAISQN